MLIKLREPVAIDSRFMSSAVGTVGQLLEELYRSSLHPQLVINIGDSDWQTAQTLGMTCIEEPFSHIGPEAHRQVAMIEGAVW